MLRRKRTYGISLLRGVNEQNRGRKAIKMSSFSAGNDEAIEQHLGTINNGRRSRNRRSMGRNSVSSTGTAKSFQNVTESLQLSRINKEISETDNSIKALQDEISHVEERRQSRGNMDDIGTDFGFDDTYFMRHSRPRTYKPIFSLSFALICFVMFLVEIGVNDFTIEEFRINPLLGPSVETLLTLGAKDTQSLQDGEAYRLVAPIFLHVGIIHLMINLLGLFGIAVPMEQEFGNWRIALISMVSGISGITLSALMAPNNVGVGASGVVFGLLGAAWADLLLNWNIYSGKNRGMLGQLFVVTVLNFIFGLMPFVDNYSHLGGFIVGLTTGTVLLKKHYGDIKQSKGLQIFLRVFSVLVLPIALSGMIFMLFLGFDVATNCDGCAYISCVPFPPNAKEKWWECTPCFNGFGSFEDFNDTFVNIICPDGDEFEADPDGVSEEDFSKDFAFFCNEVCE